MSDVTTQNDEPQDDAGQPDESGDPSDAPKPALPPRSRNPLSRDSDFVARPGFRSPSNQRTKLQKKKGAKKR